MSLSEPPPETEPQPALFEDWQPQSGCARSQDDAIKLAVSLARPVVRSMLPVDQAYATIAAAVGRGWRLGILEIPDPEGLIDFAAHILNLNIEIEEDKRDAAIGLISRTIRPLIEKHMPLGRLRAEAHDINADHGSLLTDEEVRQAVIHALYQARARVRGASAKPKAPALPPRPRYHG
ncbi:MAG: hypothetical protein ABSC06_23035 [Rhodopila sp.]|jgi:hypothetical protein